MYCSRESFKNHAIPEWGKGSEIKGVWHVGGGGGGGGVSKMMSSPYIYIYIQSCYLHS